MGNIFFVSENHGWTETYWMQATDYTTALDDLDLLCSQRAALSPTNVKIVNIRVSDATVRGDAFSRDPSSFLGTFATGLCADPNLALRILNQAGPTARATRYLRGMPESIFDYHPLAYNASSAPFTTALGSYFAYVTSKTLHVHRSAGTPPTFTTSPWTTIVTRGATIRKAGRPFGLPVGRRVRA